MKKEIKTVRYDEKLNIEAYCFAGTRRPFPNHFHDYYVIGFVESGRRCLSCKNRDYTIGRGDILLFHPYDNHECTQNDGGTFDYRGINIPKDTMLSLAEEITGERSLLKFSQNVIVDDELSLYLKTLHQMILTGGEQFEKEELLFLLISYAGRALRTACCKGDAGISR